VDVKDAVQAMVVSSNQTSVIEFDEATAGKLLASMSKVISRPKSLVRNLFLRRFPCRHQSRSLR